MSCMPVKSHHATRPAGRPAGEEELPFQNALTKPHCDIKVIMQKTGERADAPPPKLNSHPVTPSGRPAMIVAIHPIMGALCCLSNERASRCV